jgi:hypothetical protein
MRRRKRVWIDLEAYTPLKAEAKASLVKGQIIRIPSKTVPKFVKVKLVTATHTWVQPIKV